MSSASMTFGRPARHDFSRYFEALRAGFDAIWSWPLRLELWIDRRNDARMSVDDVLAMARNLEGTDPSFAADLRGAVLREQDPGR